jgi:hypothetical protein
MEYEGGADLGLGGGRVSVELTGYWKSTTDALIDQTLGFDVGQLPYEENIGDIRNTGVEAGVNAMVVESRAVSWSLSLTAAVNHNKLLRLSQGYVQQLNGAQRQVAGYPLYGLWAHRYHYADANHDGILQFNEMTVADSASYMGSSLPTQTGSLSTHVGFLRNVIAVGALFSYAGGFKVVNSSATRADDNLNSREQNILHSPLVDQARALARMAHCCNLMQGYIQDGTYLRFRELSLTYTMPTRWARVARTQSIGLVGGVRNLALWTRFAGADPEASNQGANSNHTINNDVRTSGDDAVPLARYWFLRINVGF